MASVPVQEWCEPYDWKKALRCGTVFPCLNLEFYCTEQLETSAEPVSERSRALNEISEISFAINDLTLYLDTHPDCENGLKLYRELLEQRLKLLSEYAKRFQPLTQLSAVMSGEETMRYGWAEGPLPWEGGDV